VIIIRAGRAKRGAKRKSPGYAGLGSQGELQGDVLTVRDRVRRPGLILSDFSLEQPWTSVVVRASPLENEKGGSKAAFP
jgi:hypothetical protein